MIKEKLKASAVQAKACTDALNSTSALTEEICFVYIKKYVYAKFLLEEDTETDGTLFDLARASISAMMKIPKEDVDKKDLPSCCGATAVLDKKVLLLIQLEKDLNIAISAEESASIITLKDLAATVFRKKRNSKTEVTHDEPAC